MPDGKTYDDGTLECAGQMKKMLQMFQGRNLRLGPDSMLQILGACGLTPCCATSINPPAKIRPCGQYVQIVAEYAGWRMPVLTEAGEKAFCKVPPPKAFRSVFFWRACYRERPILMTACMPPVELTTLVTPLRASTSRLS